MSLTNPDIQSQIGNSILFKTLDADAREALAQLADTVTFKDHDTLVEEGQINDKLFLIVTGNVHVWTAAADIFIDLKDLGPGDYFGEAGFLNNKPATATVEATSDGVAVTFPREALDAVLKHHPTVIKILKHLNLNRAKDTITKII